MWREANKAITTVPPVPVNGCVQGLRILLIDINLVGVVKLCFEQIVARRASGDIDYVGMSVSVTGW